MVTVFVLIRVTILRTDRNPLKGAGRNNYTSSLSTLLTVRNRGLRSAAVTSNYVRAVTILPTTYIKL
jgi:hypothetical protein